MPKKLGKWEEVGEISVDAGLCWVGDPCYILGEERPADTGKDWGEFCERLSWKEGRTGSKDGVAQWNHPMAPGLGVTVGTGWGDGYYPVYVRRAEGRVKAVMVVFDDDAAAAEGIK